MEREQMKQIITWFDPRTNIYQQNRTINGCVLCFLIDSSFNMYKAFKTLLVNPNVTP